MKLPENTINYRTAGRLFGIFFILTFMFYGIGSGVIGSITGSPDVLSNVFAKKTQIITAAIAMALLHTFFNIALPVVMLPILKPFHKNLTYGYLSAAIASTVTIIVGAIFLLLLLPLSDAFVKAGTEITPYYETLATIFAKGNFYAYQLGMAIWGLGGLMFCTILFQSKLIPRVISVWGLIGYIVFISGTILELFGYSIGVVLAIPGGLFEIFLSLWLIIKGIDGDLWEKRVLQSDR
jgi:hypothetical protein